MSAQKLVVVVVASLPRPDGVRSLLESLHRCDVPNGYALKVVVVDNGRTATLLGESGATFVHEPVAGITAARNRSIDEALKHRPWALAFLDDDEVVPPNWLEEITSAQERYGSDVVTGPVEYRLPAQVPLTPGLNIRYATQDHPAGHYLGSVSTANTLVLATWFEEPSRLRFAGKFNDAGGEDVAFFRHMRSVGGSVAWAPCARVSEIVPLKRTTARALQQRARRNGQLQVRLRLDAGESTAVGETIRALRHALRSMFRCYLVGTFSTRHRQLGRIEISRARGYWTAATGGALYREYARAD